MKFLSKGFLAGNKEPKPQKESNHQDETPGLDCSVICSLMKHFAIGVPVSYYPEYRKEIVLESLVIAYVINREVIYSATNPRCGSAHGSLVLSDQGSSRTFTKIRSFKIVVPDLGESRTKLDYIRREELSKVGGLAPGNSITLIGKQDNGQIPALETVVKKRTRFKEGHYADQIVALLEVNAETLTLTDQRAYTRLMANIPASVQVAEGDEFILFGCTLADFCDHSLRLVLDEEFSLDVLPKVGRELVVLFNLPGRTDQVSLMGEIYRKSADGVVVMLKGQVRHGQLAELGAIEILGIKSSLLQHCQISAAEEE